MLFIRLVNKLLILGVIVVAGVAGCSTGLKLLVRIIDSLAWLDLDIDSSGSVRLFIDWMCLHY